MEGANSNSEIWGKRDVDVDVDEEAVAVAVAVDEDVEELESGRKL